MNTKFDKLEAAAKKADLLYEQLALKLAELRTRIDKMKGASK